MFQSFDVTSISNFTEEQRRATRRQIQKAIDMKDSEMLERYIQQYEKLNPSFDDELLQKARRTLNALDAKEGNLHVDINLYTALAVDNNYCYHILPTRLSTVLEFQRNHTS